MMKLKNKGFTLAEVLITLAIIGVVAALTIPTVVRNYQKQQTVVRLKKTYSAIANTANLAMAEHGPIVNWVVENNKAEDFANTYVIPYLKVSKNCGTKSTGECDFSFKRPNEATTTLSTNTAKFYLNDGVFVGVNAVNTSYSGVSRKQADIYIDINGQKKPNFMGKDVFHFIYYIYWEGNPGITGKLSPYGSKDRDYNLNSSDPAVCNTGGTGEYCTRVIMQDGWEIRDDYPW